MKPLLQRVARWSLFALPVLLAAGPTSHLAAQGTAAMIPVAPFRGTLSLGDRVLAIQIRWSETAEPRIQLAIGIGMDDTTSRPMRRDPRGDTLLAVIPGFGDTLRLAPRLEGESLRGTIRQGAQTGTFALRRVAELPLDVIKPRVGEYRLDDGTLFSVMGGDNAFDGLAFIHFRTGRTGVLFAVDSTHFVAGPRRYDSDPVSYTVQFERGDRIVISTADGQRVRGSRTGVSREQDVSFPTTGGVQLAGTYTVPTTRGPHPAVIMFHGSNPHLRFRGNVVTFFASRGIAVLSWDKRGNGGSGGSLATATIDTMAADGEAAIRWLRTRPEVDPTRVGVWGISQGGWPASVVAAHDSSLAFVILHAGSSLTPAVQGEDEMRMRVIETGGTQGDMDDLLAYYRHYLDVLRGGANRESLDEVYRALRVKGNRYIWSPAVATSARERWQRGINDFDPVPYWSTARVPVLALFGEFDGYVTPEANVPVFLPEYYATMAAWLDRHLTRKR